ncbi:MAG: hypothetical protein A2508_03305 [Candidatus Lambdaproteobacteria bacterium RIFOXYD12_FULL_49_8]|nr:MAG: hypothetical protein A2508_03305 [Candidatus Lambdaproteobacteria bacterium RIFOXYD12_FULL_49_8]
MDPNIIKRHFEQVLSCSSSTDKEQHLRVPGLGVFHINVNKMASGQEVDVWFQRQHGKRLHLTPDNLDAVLNELYH